MDQLFNFWKKKTQFLSSTGSGKKQRNVAAGSMSLGATVLPSFENLAHLRAGYGAIAAFF